MGLMNVLAELHQEPDLKLNLKFEIEVLCKNLNIDIIVSVCRLGRPWAMGSQPLLTASLCNFPVSCLHQQSEVAAR